MDQLLHYIVHLDEYLTQAVEALGLLGVRRDLPDHLLRDRPCRLALPPRRVPAADQRHARPCRVLHIAVLWPLLVGAAFLGDVGQLPDRPLARQAPLSKPRKSLKPEHLQEAHEFSEEHGGLAIVACPFLPIVRTLVPFVAGVTKMEFHRYLLFAALAAVLWVTVFLGAGYLFGNIQRVQATWPSRWRSPSPLRPSPASSSGGALHAEAAGGRGVGALRTRRRAGGPRGRPPVGHTQAVADLRSTPTWRRRTTWRCQGRSPDRSRAVPDRARRRRPRRPR